MSLESQHPESWLWLYVTFLSGLELGLGGIEEERNVGTIVTP